jgi:hypothetical protein
VTNEEDEPAERLLVSIATDRRRRDFLAGDLGESVNRVAVLSFNLLRWRNDTHRPALASCRFLHDESDVSSATQPRGIRQIPAIPHSHTRAIDCRLIGSRQT